MLAVDVFLSLHRAGPVAVSRRDPLASLAVKLTSGCLTQFLAACTNEIRCPIYGDRTGIGVFNSRLRSDPTPVLVRAGRYNLRLFASRLCSAVSRAGSNVSRFRGVVRYPKPATFRPAERERRKFMAKKPVATKRVPKPAGAKKGPSRPVSRLPKPPQKTVVKKPSVQRNGQAASAGEAGCGTAQSRPAALESSLRSLDRQILQLINKRAEGTVRLIESGPTAMRPSSTSGETTCFGRS